MDYKELHDSLQHKMSMQHVYQPLMIKTLLESGNQATVDDIARVFLGDDQSQIDYYKIITKNMPGKVLRRHKVVDYKDDKFYLLLDSVSAEQKKSLIKLCLEKLAEFQVKRGAKIWQHRAMDTTPISGSLQYDVFAKAKGRCMAYGISREERSFDVDHIIPRNKGGKLKSQTCRHYATSAILKKEIETILILQTGRENSRLESLTVYFAKCKNLYLKTRLQLHFLINIL